MLMVVALVVLLLPLLFLLMLFSLVCGRGLCLPLVYS